MPTTGHAQDGPVLTGDEAEEFAAALRRAVVPRDRQAKARDLLPPVLLLAHGETEEDADGARARAARAVDELEGCLRAQGAKLVPYARVSAARLRAARGGWPVSTDIGTQLAEDPPRRTGRLRLRDFALAQDVVAWALGPDADPQGGEALRDHAYARHLRRAPLARTLWRLGGGDPGAAAGPSWFTFAVSVLLRPLFQTFPRWWWARRRDRRLLWSARSGWYADWRGIGHGRRAVGFFEHAARLVAPAGPEGRQEAVAVLERLVLRALLHDLKSAARPGRLSPWRRRRLTRYVLLLELPDGAGEEAPGAEFLAEYAAAARETGCAAVVVVAAGPARTAPADGERIGLARAAARWDRAAGLPTGATAPLLVDLPARSGAGGSALAPVAPRTFRMGPATELVLGFTALVAGLGVLAPLLLWPAVGGDGGADAGCIGGPATAPVASAPLEAGSVSPKEQYQRVVDMIEAQNRQAEEAASQLHRQVRTVVHLGSTIPATLDRERFDGAIPELRGIALAQQDLNREAGNDDQKVWLRVERVEAGERFARAPAEAREIVRKAATNPKIIGVVGITQSRTETMEAVRILGGAGIPTIGTTATADQMQVNRYYRSMAPSNSREARIVSEFARKARIVEDSSGSCAPAEAAVVIEDPTDLYSRTIGEDFAARFGGRPHILQYSPNASDSPPGSGGDRVTQEESIHAVAEAVCERITAEPRTVVYWASRSREFAAFLSSFGDDTPCEGRKLTVLGGNELTNAALTGTFRDPAWLRLYHSAHVLPVGYQRSDTARQFSDAYARTFGRKDLWRNDGHAALAYDGMQLVAAAANEAYAGTDGREVNRSNVQSSLYRGIRKEGASGYLDFDRSGGAVSTDKPLVVLHRARGGSEPVLSCGAFAQNTGQVTRWGPDQEFACPRDGR
ncbi:ABC transporter substrate-binding protein [Streptomyces sp. B1866]|uniref:ABC transporter substrate-binding protein n=1 Tax=Streptomyces sp. B1866 TaxID=3075431 RepID=UPI0028920101|nr:ABC transporter substrate-binding protein [Streptomyces sp. B1866]MDT3397056.1 ABC transporter substrate-binding protein [Streptomyces sp. B1866]